MPPTDRFQADPAAELLDGVPVGAGAQLCLAGGIARQLLECVGQGGRVPGGHQHAGLSVVHHLRDARH